MWAHTNKSKTPLRCAVTWPNAGSNRKSRHNSSRLGFLWFNKRMNERLWLARTFDMTKYFQVIISSALLSGATVTCIICSETAPDAKRVALTPNRVLLEPRLRYRRAVMYQFSVLDPRTTARGTRREYWRRNVLEDSLFTSYSNTEWKNWSGTATTTLPYYNFSRTVCDWQLTWTSCRSSVRGGG